MRSIAMLVLLGGVSVAQESYVASLEGAIKGGGIAAAHEMIRVDVLSGDPSWARRVCAAAVGCDLAAALQAKDDLKDAAERIRRIGARCVEDHEDSADAWSAAADAAYFSLRVLRACGEETGTEDWLAVADALVKLHGIEPAEGAPLERAVRCMREGRGAKGVDADRLKKREDELCEEGIRLHPGNALFAQKQRAAELDAILALLDADGYKEAKPRLLALLGAAQDDTVYNDAVTVAKKYSRKLGIKADYRLQEQKLFNNIHYKAPRGDRWGIEEDTITQYGRDGKLLRRFVLKWFKRNTNYVLGDTEYDGSNEKGMALITERDVLSVIVKTERRTGIVKKSLNRNIKGVQYFDIAGYDKDAGFTRFQTYLWRSDQRPWLTYRLWIIELRELDDLDPEAQLVIDSMSETKYDGKAK